MGGVWSTGRVSLCRIVTAESGATHFNPVWLCFHLDSIRLKLFRVLEHLFRDPRPLRALRGFEELAQPSDVDGPRDVTENVRTPPAVV